jgi:hypothetical protein
MTLAVLLLSGCATTQSARACRDEGGACFGGEERDDFQLLQQSARLPEGAFHEAGRELETDDARELWEALARSPTTLHNFGPKRSLVLLLRQVLTADEDVPYPALLERTRPFRGLVVMRPDGYLARALTGEPLQRFGQMELRDGTLLVGGRFEVGAFYRNHMGVFYPVDDLLQQASIIPLGELGLEHDWFNLALDGAEDALVEMVLGLAHFFTEPVRSLEGLAQLPSAVAGLIASSPEYFARYSTRPLREQIREAARLSTHLITFYGSAAGSATRVGSTGGRVPVLSVSADGVLAVERMSVPAGSSAAALGTGAGAVYVLMGGPTPGDDSAGGARPAPAGEPGQWGPADEYMSNDAARYQQQVTGHAAGEAYWVGGVGRNSGGVAFDGFKDGVLLECKGLNYANKFRNLDPKAWFKNTGAQKLVEQARRQFIAAKGVPIRWHVAEAEAAGAIQKLLANAGFEKIQVVHTPMLKKPARP